MPSVPPPLPNTWWRKNWWWVAVLAGVMLLAAAGGSVFAVFKGLHWIQGQIKTSEGYRLGLATVRADQRVVAALGEPIEDKDMISGSFNNSTNRRSIMVMVPLSGPKGRASLVLAAAQRDGPWQFNTLMVTIEAGSQIIDLRDAANKAH